MHAPQRIGQLAHPLLVRATDHEGANPVLHHLFDGDHLAERFGRASGHHVETLVQDHLGPPLEGVVLDVRVEVDTHLATARQDVHRSVVVLADDHPIRGRRPGELVHLFAEGGDVLTGLPERVGELLVLGDSLGELALGLEQTLFEHTHSLGCLGQLAPQREDLVLQQAQGVPVGVNFLVVPAAVVSGMVSHARTSSVPNPSGILR